MYKLIILAFCTLFFITGSNITFAHAPHKIINTIEFKETLVRDAVRIVAEQSGMNIVVTNKASQQMVTLFLQNVRAENVLATLCKVAGLWYRKDISSNVYRVMTNDEYLQDVKVFQNYVTKVYRLSYFNSKNVATALADLYGDRITISEGAGIEAFSYVNAKRQIENNESQEERETKASKANSKGVKAKENNSFKEVETSFSSDQVEEIAKMLSNKLMLSSTDLKQYLGNNSKVYVTINQEHNTVIVRASDEAVFQDIDNLIGSLDKPVSQVLLEMKILSLGVDDSFRSLFNSQYNESSVDSGGLTSKTLGLGNFPLEGGTLTYRFINDKIIGDIELNKIDNNSKLLSAPVLMASNHRPARMFVGEEVVLTRGASLQTITPNDGPPRDIITIDTEIRDIGTVLEVVPRINQDRTITLSIRQESSSVSPNKKPLNITGSSTSTSTSDLLLETVVTSELQGTIIAKDGLTVAVGGLFKKESIKEQTKVPLLGDIPLMGRMFRKEISKNITTELVLLITPHVVQDSSQLDIASLEKVVERGLEEPRGESEQTKSDSFINQSKPITE